MAQKRTAAKFAEWVKVPENVEAFFGLMERQDKPLRFRDACFSIPVPYTLMHSFVDGNDVLKARYMAVLKARAQEMQDKREDIANKILRKKNVQTAEVAAAKLACDVYEGQAAKWNKELYGETLRVEKTINVSADAGLLGTAGELLKRLSAPTVRSLPEKTVVDAEVIDASR